MTVVCTHKERKREINRVREGERGGEADSTHAEINAVKRCQIMKINGNLLRTCSLAFSFPLSPSRCLPLSIVINQQQD